jgi:hypothetical protein
MKQCQMPSAPGEPVSVICLVFPFLSIAMGYRGRVALLHLKAIGVSAMCMSLQLGASGAGVCATWRPMYPECPFESWNLTW